MSQRNRFASFGRELVARVPPIKRLRVHRDKLAVEVTALQARVSSLEAENAGFRAEHAGSVRLAFPPGHFYSPIPDLDEVKLREEEIFSLDRGLPGVDVDVDRQLGRLEEFAQYYEELPYPEAGTAEGFRYQFDNAFFGFGDAIAYYCMLRSIRPRQVLEIGSGWSSAVALDVDEHFLGGTTEMTFVEPFPDRLEALLSSADRGRVRIFADPLYRVDRTVFDTLVAGDILFIDSTHVSKVGSDVNQLILDILPQLNAGVHVHVHDIFFPFEYPKEWVFDGRAWNENYLLRAFLAQNEHVRINWFNSYLASFHAAEVTARLPLWARNPGGSIWFETV